METRPICWLLVRAMLLLWVNSWVEVQTRLTPIGEKRMWEIAVKGNRTGLSASCLLEA